MTNKQQCNPENSKKRSFGERRHEGISGSKELRGRSRALRESGKEFQKRNGNEEAEGDLSGRTGREASRMRERRERAAESEPKTVKQG